MISWFDRVRGALLFGFSVIFAFALTFQLVTDFVHLVLGLRVKFLFDRGLFNAFNDMETLIRVLTSLSFFSLVLAAIFFVVKLRRKYSFMDVLDDPDTDN